MYLRFKVVVAVKILIVVFWVATSVLEKRIGSVFSYGLEHHVTTQKTAINITKET
jgi:hypothetical protein